MKKKKIGISSDSEWEISLFFGKILKIIVTNND